MIVSLLTPALLFVNVGLLELLCILSVVLVTFVVVALIALRSRRRDCPHCSVSNPMSVSVCTACGKKIE